MFFLECHVTTFICFRFLKHFLATYPTGTQRPDDVPLWSYFDRDVPVHNRTKIELIRFLTYFGFAMSGMHLGSRNVEKFP